MQCAELEAKRRSAAVTRLLRLLRAHGAIEKVTATHRYQVTTSGRELIAALTTVQAAQPKSLQTPTSVE